ncbi:MAG: hypothetical protein ACYTG5_00790 [Planctomycetota bacterium]|jgi:hypothetical protein
MSLLIRILIFVPVIYLIMVVYAGQKETEGMAVLRTAARKTVKVLAWTVVLVAGMELIEFIFLP